MENYSLEDGFHTKKYRYSGNSRLGIGTHTDFYSWSHHESNLYYSSSRYLYQCTLHILGHMFHKQSLWC